MDQLEGKQWKVVSRLSGGRFSDVFKIERVVEGKESELRMGEPVNYSIFALKVVDPDECKPPHNIRNEIQILQKLEEHRRRSPNRRTNNVVTLVDVIYNNVEYGLIFPYYDLSLTAYIKKNIKTRSKFNLDGSISPERINNVPIATTKSLLYGILNGLSWIHDLGIIHRDINPNNILLANDKEISPVIIDFGISYEEPDNNGLESCNMKFTDIATGFYKAPELLLSKRDYSNKVDIWAVGILMTLLLSEDGREVFDPDATNSDLVLLSNIISVFGSPPTDWSDCVGLSSFEAMNTTFFKKPAKPLEEIIPRLFKNPHLPEFGLLRKLFVGLTQYENKHRLSAADALKLLC